MAVLLGLCEGEFPAAFSDGGILNENDKRLLDELGLELTSREDKIISDELFYVYRAMTKPSEKLILSTCLSHVGGGKLTPSVAYNRVRYILPYITEKSFDLKRISSIIENGGKIVGSPVATRAPIAAPKPKPIVPRPPLETKRLVVSNLEYCAAHI